MTSCGALAYLDGFREGLKPQDPLTVDQWAERYRILQQSSSSEPGPYRTSRTPYLREIMKCLSPSSPVREVVFMKGSQVGGSECGFNWIGYIMDYNPGPTMMVQPTVDIVKSVSKERITPMINSVPALIDKVGEAKSKTSSNTIQNKAFPGGFLNFSGANSAASLRSRPVQNLMLDEIDAYPRDVGGEGDPVKLSEKRTTTFYRRKILKISTPTYKGASRIEDEYDSSTKERYHVRCPHCGVKQWLKWKQVRWVKNKDDGNNPIPESVHYICEANECRIEEHHKPKFLADGDWIAEFPGRKKRGFHLSALYSPLGWYSWAEMALDFHEAKNDPEKLKVFVNTGLGETFEVKSGDTPKWRNLYNRRENYAIGRVPDRACVVTAAVDVQKDRLECTIVGWNRKESWIIDHVMLTGDTSLEVNAGPWRKMDDLLATDLINDNGHVFKIAKCGLDSGYNTMRVYEYVRKYPKICFALKGTDNSLQPIVGSTLIDIRQSDGRKIRRGVRVWKLGGGVLKSDAYGRFKQQKPTDEEMKEFGYPSTFVHFPMLNEEYFRQITAEQLILQTKRTGHSTYVWTKSYPNNEALDCYCYNIAAYYLLQCNRWDEKRWRETEAHAGIKAISRASEVPRETKQPEKKPLKPMQERRRSSYWNS